jgi:hypothetical protein
VATCICTAADAQANLDFLSKGNPKLSAFSIQDETLPMPQKPGPLGANPRLPPALRFCTHREIPYWLI